MKTPKIKRTTEYDAFVTILGNRPVNRRKVDNLKSDIESGLDLTGHCPVVVYQTDKGLMIVDGQHRFTACRELAHPIFYVEAPELSLQEIARLNSRSDNWSKKDFLNCYCELGDSDYITLRSFISDTGIVYSASVELLMYGNCRKRGDAMERFRSGTFKVEHEDEARRLAGKAEELFGRYRFYKNRELITAIQELEAAGKIDWKKLATKLESAPNEMVECSSWKNYVFAIERVYNHRNAKREVIY